MTQLLYIGVLSILIACSYAPPATDSATLFVDPSSETGVWAFNAGVRTTTPTPVKSEDGSGIHIAGTRVAPFLGLAYLGNNFGGGMRSSNGNFLLFASAYIPRAVSITPFLVVGAGTAIEKEERDEDEMYTSTQKDMTVMGGFSMTYFYSDKIMIKGASYRQTDYSELTDGGQFIPFGGGEWIGAYWNAEVVMSYNSITYGEQEYNKGAVQSVTTYSIGYNQLLSENSIRLFAEVSHNFHFGGSSDLKPKIAPWKGDSTNVLYRVQ